MRLRLRFLRGEVMGCCKAGQIELPPITIRGKKYCNCTGITTDPIGQIFHPPVIIPPANDQDIRIISEAGDQGKIEEKRSTIDEKSASVSKEILPIQTANSNSMRRYFLLGLALILIIVALGSMKG